LKKIVIAETRYLTTINVPRRDGLKVAKIEIIKP